MSRPHTSTGVLALLALLALLAAPAARAQAPADTFALREIVVTALRLPIPKDAVPAAVTVIAGEELRARGVKLVADALRGVTSAALAQNGSHGGLTSLFLRGGESDYVQVLIDGVAVNDPGGSFDFAHLTTDNIDRIEIVRGPVSVLYGSDAVTGVVQIFTRDGRGPPAGRLSARAGLADRIGPQVSTDERRYHTLAWDAAIAGGGSDVGYALSLARFATNGAYAFNNDYRNDVVSARIQATPAQRTRASLSLRYTDLDYHFPTGGAGEVEDRNQQQRRDALAAGVELAHFFGERLEARLLFAHYDTDASGRDRPDHPADTIGSFASRTTEQLERRSVDVRANFYATPATVLSAGAELERERGEGFSEYESNYGGYFKSTATLDVERSNRALYAQAFTDLGQQLSLTAGTRVEDNEAFGSFVTSRIGVAYRRSGARLRAAFGTAFKEPTFFENFGSGFGDRGNPELQPERSRSWEVGAERSWLDGRLAASATYYDQRFRDLIQFTFATPSPEAPNYFNIAGATADGVELELRYTPAAGLSVAGNYGYLRSRVEGESYDSLGVAPGDRLLRRPNHTSSLLIDYRPAARTTLHVAANYIGARDDLDFASFPPQRVVLPAYVRVDAAAEYEVLRRAPGSTVVALTARVENLLDRKYDEVKGFPARRRALLAGVRVGFGLGL